MLTQEMIEQMIETIEYSKLGKKTTVCLMTLKNGFEIVATSSCIDPKDYDQEVGNKIALEKAMDKLWELEGYRNS